MSGPRSFTTRMVDRRFSRLVTHTRVGGGRVLRATLGRLGWNLSPVAVRFPDSNPYPANGSDFALALGAEHQPTDVPIDTLRPAGFPAASRLFGFAHCRGGPTQTCTADSFINDENPASSDARLKLRVMVGTLLVQPLRR